MDRSLVSEILYFNDSLAEWAENTFEELTGKLEGAAINKLLINVSPYFMNLNF